jgi:hypothetical protein
MKPFAIEVCEAVTCLFRALRFFTEQRSKMQLSTTKKGAEYTSKNCELYAIVLLSELVTFLKILLQRSNTEVLCQNIWHLLQGVELSEFFLFVRRIYNRPGTTENSELRVILTCSRFGGAE